jgi:hypothetical protein
MSTPQEVILVVQQGGSTREMYIHTFDTLGQANKFRKSAWDKGAYSTSEPLTVPVGIEDYIVEIQSIISAALDLV